MLRSPIFSACLAVMLALACGGQLQAQSPVYQVLRPATPRTPCNVLPTPAVPYAYGWFGASPKPMAERQFGIHRGYTQWRIH